MTLNPIPPSPKAQALQQAVDPDLAEWFRLNTAEDTLSASATVMPSPAHLSAVVTSLRAGETIRVIGGGNSELAWVAHAPPGQQTVSLSPADPDFGGFEVLDTGLPHGNALVRAGKSPDPNAHSGLERDVWSNSAERSVTLSVGTPYTDEGCSW